MIRSGELRDLVDAARLIGVTRARMTQIANLLLLAPDLQEKIFFRKKEKRITSERDLRPVLRYPLWQEQKRFVSMEGQFHTIHQGPIEE